MIPKPCAPRYSPNLSRRCSHLIVSDSTAAAAPPSEKLRTALAQQAKWGISIVTVAAFMAQCNNPTAAPVADHSSYHPEQQQEQPPWLVHFSQLPLDGLYAEPDQYPHDTTTTTWLPQQRRRSAADEPASMQQWADSAAASSPTEQVLSLGDWYRRHNEGDDLHLTPALITDTPSSRQLMARPAQQQQVREQGQQAVTAPASVDLLLQQLASMQSSTLLNQVSALVGSGGSSQANRVDATVTTALADDNESAQLPTSQLVARLTSMLHQQQQQQDQGEEAKGTASPVAAADRSSHKEYQQQQQQQQQCREAAPPARPADLAALVAELQRSAVPPTATAAALPAVEEPLSKAIAAQPSLSSWQQVDSEQMEAKLDALKRSGVADGSSTGADQVDWHRHCTAGTAAGSDRSVEELIAALRKATGESKRASSAMLSGASTTGQLTTCAAPAPQDQPATLSTDIASSSSKMDLNALMAALQRTTVCGTVINTNSEAAATPPLYHASSSAVPSPHARQQQQQSALNRVQPSTQQQVVAVAAPPPPAAAAHQETPPEDSSGHTTLAQLLAELRANTEASIQVSEHRVGQLSELKSSAIPPSNSDSCITSPRSSSTPPPTTAAEPVACTALVQEEVPSDSSPLIKAGHYSCSVEALAAALAGLRAPATPQGQRHSYNHAAPAQQRDEEVEEAEQQAVPATEVQQQPEGQLTVAAALPMDGVTALLDPQLPADTRDQVAAALVSAGGRVAAGRHLGCGASLVVCEPHRAAQYLHLLVDLMSPAALLKACASGCDNNSSAKVASAASVRQSVVMSADICRALQMRGAAAGGGAGTKSAASAGASISSDSSCDMGGQTVGADDNCNSSSPLSSAAVDHPVAGGLQLMRAALTPGPAVRCSSCIPGTAVCGGVKMVHTRPTVMMPPELIGGAFSGCWSVVDDAHGERPAALRDEELEAIVLKVCVARGGGRARLISWSIMQYRVPALNPTPTTLQTTSHPQHLHTHTHTHKTRQGAPFVTLLLPQDQQLILGHSVSRLPVPASGLSCGALLDHLRDYYAQAVRLDESAAKLLRQVQGGRAGQGDEVPRSALLGSRIALEGVVRATRDPSSCVYEVLLAL